MPGAHGDCSTRVWCVCGGKSKPRTRPGHGHTEKGCGTTQQAYFKVVGNVCAIQAHTQKPCPNGQTLQILFTAFASEGNYRKSDRHFFIDVISGGSAKRQWYLFFGTYCMELFFEKYFLLYGRS
jgi:hypothetical protein